MLMSVILVVEGKNKGKVCIFELRFCGWKKTVKMYDSNLLGILFLV